MALIQFSPKQQQTITAPFNHTLDVFEGSPRSGKTCAALFRYATYLIQTDDETHLVAAYSQEQAYRLVMEGDGMGLLHIFAGCSRIKHGDFGAYLEIKTPKGIRKVLYKGGGKADSLKALTGLSLGSVYFCEINLLNMDFIQECFRRTYAARNRYHQADLNPPAPQHPVISEVFDIQDTRWTHWTCRDNPILTPKRLKEIEETCAKNPYLYKRDWLGERAIPEGVIYFMFDDKRHVLSKLPDDAVVLQMYFAGDGGTTDATSIGCYLAADWKGQKVLFRVGNWYYDGGQKAMSTQAKEICGDFIPYMRQKYGRRETGIWIDPACKALRLEMDKLKFWTSNADNNAHDVNGNSRGLMCGIEMLQSGITDGHFYLVDDDRYGAEYFVKEVGLYCLDKNGAPIDKYNHSMDETRYGYNRFAKQYGLWGAGISARKKPDEL